MERWGAGVGRPASRRCRDYPSFSSTLLDAIYRSIDETDERGETKEQQSGRSPESSAYYLASAKKKQSSAFGCESRRFFSDNAPLVSRSRRQKLYSIAATTSSSSDCSSYGDFSSSEADSVSAPQRTGLRPIRTTAAAAASFQARSEKYRTSAAPTPLPASVPPVSEEKKKPRHGSIRSRLCDLKMGRSPESPGARLASFLNSLFSAKSKVPAGGEKSSACSTASSYSRSCLSKMPSSRERPEAGKRTVRFSSVSVILDEECRPCGQKLIYDGCLPVRTAKPTPPPPPARKMAEMQRRFEKEEDDDEDDDDESDSSSDLFELENLAVVGRFHDELPVYETTHLANYHGLFF